MAITTAIPDLPDHDEVTDICEQHGQVHPASEIHGILTAMLVINPATPKMQFSATILGNDASQDTLLKTTLDNLYDITRSQLFSEMIDFQLLLSDEEASLESRLDNLAQWSHGFVYGLAAQGVSSFDNLSDDSKSFIADIGAIASNEFEIGHDDNEETILVEVEEYLRAGTLMLQDELYQPTTSTTKH